jgi:hypothetical protein
LWCAGVASVLGGTRRLGTSKGTRISTCQSDPPKRRFRLVVPGGIRGYINGTIAGIVLRGDLTALEFQPHRDMRHAGCVMDIEIQPTELQQPRPRAEAAGTPNFNDRHETIMASVDAV